MIIEVHACCARPLLDDSLDIHDSSVCESIQVHRYSSLEVVTWNRHHVFEMVGPVDQSKEHPVRRHDECQATVSLLSEFQELLHLLVAVLEALWVEVVWLE